MYGKDIHTVKVVTIQTLLIRAYLFRVTFNESKD